MAANDHRPAQHNLPMHNPTMMQQQVPTTASPPAGPYPPLLAQAQGVPLNIPPPSPGVKLFVGSLPREWTAEQVRQLFTQFGAVLDVLVFSDRNSGESKGASFVTMSTAHEADAAIVGLHKKRTLATVKRPLQVCHAHRDVAKLFVGSLPANVTEADLTRLFSTYGHLVEMYLMKNSAKPKAARSAFLHFLDRTEAQNALALNGQKPWPTCTRPIVVRFAYTAKEKQQKVASRAHQREVIRNATAVNSSLFPQHQQSPQIPTQVQQQQPADPSMQGQPQTLPMHNQVGIGAPTQQPQLLSVPTNATPSVSSNPAQQPQQPQQGQPIGAPGGSVFLPANTNTVNNLVGSSVYVYNLPYWFTDPQLFALFSPFGQVLGCQLFVDQQPNNGGQQQQGKSVGMVTYLHNGAATTAQASMNGYPVAADCQLKVQLVNPNPVVANTNPGVNANPNQTPAPSITPTVTAQPSQPTHHQHQLVTSPQPGNNMQQLQQGQPVQQQLVNNQPPLNNQ
eukprot:TRINITY_DN58013_c0_g1_i1.p1 TRINITY_DN58013_c0_g1~~TRINITY_DN58013_c0_g1_i1.p1  ORF type:complete len:507 (+),score=70.07 TRINITY_DN58013_c0_g1_i1:92-1612(+)